MIKVIGRVPIDDYEYYVAKYDHYYMHCKKGDFVAIKKDYANELNYGKLANKIDYFIEDDCREATEEEKDKIYEELFGNAIVIEEEHRYDKNLQFIHLFYTTERVIDYRNSDDDYELLGQLDMEVDDRMKCNLVHGTPICYKNIMHSWRSIFFTNKVPTNCRKATPTEAHEYANILCQKKNEEELKREEEIKMEHMKQSKESTDKEIIITSSNTTDNEVKQKELYDLYTIREFYKEFINTDTIPQKTRKKMYLYGGTVPYILGHARIPNTDRKFGDVDMYVEERYMPLVRNALQHNSKFQMLSDSLELTSQVLDQDMYNQDYGFKGNLFGIPISVMPIGNENKYQHMDGDLCGKTFDEQNPRHLFDTIILYGTPIACFTKTVNLYGNSIRIVPLEYTVVSKASAINSEKYPEREEKDIQDIEYIAKHFKLEPILIEGYTHDLPSQEDRIVKVRTLKPTNGGFKVENSTVGYKYENGLIRPYYGS